MQILKVERGRDGVSPHTLDGESRILEDQAAVSQGST